MPDLFRDRGDAHAEIDAAPGSLDALLALAARQASDGMADAPWPPHYAKAEGEPARVMPSRAKGVRPPARKVAPLIVIAKAALKADALAGLERWKERHPAAAAKLIPDDVLVDAMRGRFTAWYRIRVNLRNVPEEERPAAEAPDPDYAPTW